MTRLLAALTGVVIAARILLFEHGIVFGDERARYANLVVAVFVALTVTIGLSRWLRRREHGSKISSEITTASAALASAAVAFSVVQITLPGTPVGAAAPACRGVPVQGAPFLAQTTAFGVNARAGASQGFGQIDRFAGSCTLGFSGYCIGQPVANTTTDVNDTRWFVVFRRHELVSAAKVEAQSPTAALGRTPAPQCGKNYGGTVAAPGVLHFAVAERDPNVLALSVSSDNAQLMGYAVRVVDQLGGGYPYSGVGSGPIARPPLFGGTYKAFTAIHQLRDGTGSVELAANACLAADVPYGSPSVYLLRFDKGNVSSVRPSRPASRPDGNELAHIACSGPA